MSKRNAQPTTPTRKQAARSRREQEQLRLIYIGLGTVAALILIVLAYGLYQTYVVEPNIPVATVNGTDITTAAYQERVKYERFLLDEQLQQVQVQQQSALAQAENEQLADFLASQYEQLANQLLQQRTIVDRQTVNTMIDDKLVETEAAQRGLTVSEEEITEYINRIQTRLMYPCLMIWNIAEHQNYIAQHRRIKRRWKYVFHRLFPTATTLQI